MHPRDDYDAYELDEDGPDDIYVNRLNLVLVGQEAWLVDETSHTEIVQTVRRLSAEGGEIVIWPLDRSQAAPFARYMNWDAVCSSFSDDHPIHVTRIPEMPPKKMDAADPRLQRYDFDAIRVAHAAQVDQLRMRPNRFHDPSHKISIEDMPPTD